MDASTLDFTLEEVERIEDLVDVPMSEWATAKQGALTAAMVWTVRLRRDPEAKLTDVKRLRLSELDAELLPFVAGDTAAT